MAGYLAPSSLNGLVAAKFVRVEGTATGWPSRSTHLADSQSDRESFGAAPHRAQNAVNQPLAARVRAATALDPVLCVSAPARGGPDITSRTYFSFAFE